jgi:putative pyruvate formate lyase activating enzyme
MQSSFINARKLGRVVHEARIDHKFIPSYLKLHESGELKSRGEMWLASMKKCALCPRRCGIDRLKGARGPCRAGKGLEISDFYSGHGEENCLTGFNGSGMIYFTHCCLRCIFCNQWEYSQKRNERFYAVEELVEMMMELQNSGCHNIHFVTPSQYMPFILLAVDQAAAAGLRLPIVYNSSGYEEPAVLAAIKDVVDIYLVDLKFLDHQYASDLTASGEDYPEVAKKAILQMVDQVGVASPGIYGLMLRGVMIRHLVMPNFVSSSTDVFNWIAKNLPHDIYIHILSDYEPVFQANSYPLISRPITRGEYSDAVLNARNAGLINLETKSLL